MLSLQNKAFTLTCLENGHELALVDRQRGVRWLLDEQTIVFYASSNNPWGGYEGDPQRMTPVSAQLEDSGMLVVAYNAGETRIEMDYLLEEGYVEVRLTTSPFPSPQPSPKGGGSRLPLPSGEGRGEGKESRIGAVSLPGSFTPEGERLKLLLPIMQGMLWDGSGPAFSSVRGEGSHTGFSMAFTGYLGEKGGLLVTAETRDDCRWWFGKDEISRQGHPHLWAANLQIASLGSIRYERVVRLTATDPDIVSVAKQYRRMIIKQGRFKSWEEKIAERPALERLFGALMCYIGYCEDSQDGVPFDYLENFRKLKKFGFDRALVYPGRFNIYYPDIRMGGVPAINLSPETVNAVKDLGYDVAPWSWLNEALDTGPDIRTIYRRTSTGEAIPHWAIDDQQWYLACYATIPEFQRRALKEAIPDMTWDHFDVLSCVPPMECYALDHSAHDGRPLSRSEDRQAVRQVFLEDQRAGLIVSSENFNDAYSLEYDLGSVKAWPQYGPWPFWPVPLTGLVYHDSLIHSWWEVHSYNTRYFGRTQMPGPFFEYGGGRPHLMAALDALMGCPPDVFPFGAQYGYTGKGKETFLFKQRFEDSEVQIALQQALPVARLHRQIGKQEMVDFKILSENGYLQETTFADGTRVAANFSRDFMGAEGLDPLPPESWRVIE